MAAKDPKRSVFEILSEYVKKYPDSSRYDDVIEQMKASNVWSLDEDCWDDEYEILGYLPPCPKCRTKMRYNDGADMLQCPVCGYSVAGDEYPYRDMPSWDEITEEDYK